MVLSGEPTRALRGSSGEQSMCVEQRVACERQLASAATVIGIEKLLLAPQGPATQVIGPNRLNTFVLAPPCSRPPRPTAYNHSSARHHINTSHSNNPTYYHLYFYLFPSSFHSNISSPLPTLALPLKSNNLFTCPYFPSPVFLLLSIISALLLCS